MSKIICEIYVYVGFYGAFDPQELLELLSPEGVISEAQRAGEPLRYVSKAAQFDSLEVKTPKRQTYELEELLDELLGASSAWAEAGAWAERHHLDVFLRVVAKFGEITPALVLRPDHLAWLLALGATVDMDLHHS